MCLLVTKAKDIKLSQVTAERVLDSWSANPHGGGIGYIDGSGQIQIEKSLEFEGFKTILYGLIGSTSPMIIHTRYATQGIIDLNNTHPFIVDNLIVGHNGIINRYGDAVISDTRHYIYTTGYRLLKNKDYEQIQKDISWSRIAVLDADTKNINLINGNAGHYRDDDLCWYSNNSYVIFYDWYEWPAQETYNFLFKYSNINFKKVYINKVNGFNYSRLNIIDIQNNQSNIDSLNIRQVKL